MTVLSREQHPISRKSFSSAGLKVLYRLRSKGYWAFLVGGAVRDLLDDRPPRDFDVVTSAQIPEILEIFAHSRSIGKRYPIVHVYFRGETIEITSLKNVVPEDRLGTLTEDATRRDFTVNAIYYDINDFEVVDPLNGITDLKAKLLRTIGDPIERMNEDPVRMLRALRLQLRLGFALDPALEASIRSERACLTEVTIGRRYEETTRLCLSSSGGALLKVCSEYGLLEHLWPQGSELMQSRGLDFFDQITSAVPVSYNRGGFDRLTHAALWLFLFLGSKIGQTRKKSDDLEAHFKAFLGPLEMPHFFKLLVVEALQCIDGLGLCGLPKTKLGEIGNEAFRLVEAYVNCFCDNPETILDGLAPAARKNKKPRGNPNNRQSEDPQRPKRRRRRRSRQSKQ